MIAEGIVRNPKEIYSPNVAQGLLYRGFFDDSDTILQEAVGFFHSNERKERVCGKMGAAFESCTTLYTCNQQSQLSFMKRINEGLEGYMSLHTSDLGTCFSIVEFKTLEGMSSHKDYSYNKYLLGTLVLEGELLCGCGSKRETAYMPNNMKLLSRGDLLVIKAPTDESTERPFFFMTSPVQSIVSRFWIRNQQNCPSCSNRGDNG